MFRKRQNAEFPPPALTPVGGEIYAHVFENAATGLARDLFWNVAVELRSADGEPAAFAADWLTWPVRRWRDLDGMTLGQVRRPDLTEASLYQAGEHHPAEVRSLELRAGRGAAFELAVTAAAQVETNGVRRTVTLSFAGRVAFAGIYVVTDNLEPKPSSPALAAAAVAAFMALDDLRGPRADGWRFVLEPLG